MALNLVSRLFSNVRAFASPIESIQSIARFHSMVPGTSTQPAAGGAWSLISVRTNIRNHFPRPRESKRVLTHGFHKRMSTRGGRLILMRRILKGKHVLSH
ncbi:39S ribosomal protein L34, mitochondrial [Sitodiplosis mosellana]|uniref:39S ribosomal protein L34, mitochondrial n=1 Tax=Sitodiplosis mosellana TaxID=263140 RepID=UPI00244498AD|nr:39S ribosomal protein L34, mitochondrial [Sitodiplosis mosellana]